MYMNNTVDTLGTASIIMNSNIGNENTSVVKVEHSGGYTVGNLIYSEIISGGSGVFAVGGIAEVSGAIVLNEG